MMRVFTIMAASALSLSVTGTAFAASSISQAASCAGISYPHSVEAGKEFTVTAKMKNTGRKTWLKNEAALSVRTAGSVKKEALKKNITPRKTVSFSIKMIAPTDAGTFAIKTQMWDGKDFGNMCKANITVKAKTVSSTSSKTSAARNSISSFRASVIPVSNTQAQQSSSIQTYVAPAASSSSSASSIASSVSSNSSAAQSSSSQQNVVLESSSSSSAAPVVALVNTGNLYVTQGTVFGQQQLLGGRLEDAVLNLNFTADTNEDIDVTDLQISISAANTLSIDRLELYMDGSSTPFTIATVAGCGTDPVPAGAVTYCSNTELQQFIVAKGQTKNVNVRPRMNTDEYGAMSGEQFSFFIDANISAVKARGMQSSNTLGANDQDATAEGEVFIGTNMAAANSRIAGALNTVVLAKLASITNANPDADGTLTPTGLYPVGQFTFTAMTNTNVLNGLNKWTLDTVIFSGEFPHTRLHGYEFFLSNKADPLTKATCQLIGPNNKPMVGTPEMTIVNGGMIRCENLANDPIVTSLGSGQSMTLVLEANIIETIGTEQTNLQFYLNRFNDPALTTVHFLRSHIQWIDEDTAQKAYMWAESSTAAVYSTKYVK